MDAQKIKFSIKDFFSKFDQIRRKLRIWSLLLKKSLTANFIFCVVYFNENTSTNFIEKPHHECLTGFKKLLLVEGSEIGIRCHIELFLFNFSETSNACHVVELLVLSFQKQADVRMIILMPPSTYGRHSEHDESQTLLVCAFCKLGLSAVCKLEIDSYYFQKNFAKIQ